MGHSLQNDRDGATTGRVLAARYGTPTRSVDDRGWDAYSGMTGMEQSPDGFFVG